MQLLTHSLLKKLIALNQYHLCFGSPVLSVLDLKLSERRNIICLPHLHRRQPGQAAETRSTPSGQPFTLILQLGRWCKFKLYLELLSIFSWKSQLKPGTASSQAWLMLAQNKQTKTRIKITRHFVFKVFMCIRCLPPPFGHYVSPAQWSPSQPTQATPVHGTGRTFVIPSSRNSKETRLEADNLRVTALMASLSCDPGQVM